MAIIATWNWQIWQSVTANNTYNIFSE